MPTHECCWLITIPDGKTAEGEARTQPHARIERAAFFFFVLLSSSSKHKMYVFKCIRMSLIVIGVIFFFPGLCTNDGGILHVLQFDTQKLD